MAGVRLRPRSRRSSAATDPSERPVAAAITVGNLDSEHRALVDPAGRVVAGALGWSLDWWIGAEDRWHHPASEAAVRQQLVGASPVVETRVRIPSGDAVSRAYGARGPAGEDVLVVEVHNDSQVPFALALGVQPHGAAGRVHSVSLGGTELRVDGSSIWLPRSPGRIALSAATDERDAVAVVLAGDAEPVHAASVTCADGDARAVLLFPLAHTATVRLAIRLDGGAGAVEPSALPSAAQVASGWATHTRRGARIEVPDRRLREAVAASARFLLLASDDERAALALEHLGFPDEADQSGRPSLAHLAARWRFTRQPPAVDPLLIAGLVDELGRSPRPADRARGHAALPAVADLLQHLGEDRAAADVLALHRDHVAPAVEPDDPFVLRDAPTRDVGGHAALVLAVRHLLVDDLDDGLALSPVVPDAWLGQGWEVHGLPTAHGRLSYAIRWHGERPALLWELEPHAGAAPVRLTAPALDPSWSSTEAAGEALLAPVPVPERPAVRRGLSIPVTIEPIRRRP